MSQRKRTPREKRRIEKGLCIKGRCTRKGVKKKGYLCHTHYHRLCRDRNPFPHIYQCLKSNAKRRGSPFSLEFAEFKQWCIENNYHKLRGRKPGKFHIDRIDVNDPRGYHLKNIQIMEFSENVRKYHAYEKRGLPYPGADKDVDLDADIDIPESSDDWLEEEPTYNDEWL